MTVIVAVMVVVTGSAFASAVVGSRLRFKEGLEGVYCLGVVVKGLWVEHIEGVLLKVNSCGCPDVNHSGLVHIGCQAAQMLAHENGEADRYVKYLSGVDIVGV